MVENKFIEVHAKGYKVHLCSSEQQADQVILDIESKNPKIQCLKSEWASRHLFFDNMNPIVLEEDFYNVDLGDVILRFAMPDFTSLVWALRHAEATRQDDLVFLSCKACCSVLTPDQAEALDVFIKDNYEKFKSIEDKFYTEHEKAILATNSLEEALAGKKKNKDATKFVN